jgi:PIN domain nuclease of toxin-antitoxin system
VRYLLDTHTLLWFVSKQSECSALALESISDEDNEIYVSLASIWEMAIKVTAGKLQLSRPVSLFVAEQFEINGFALLPITLSHVVRTTQLALEHRDPFDRMLIAQSLFEDIPIISRDGVFDRYGVSRIW